MYILDTRWNAFTLQNTSCCIYFALYVAVTERKEKKKKTKKWKKWKENKNKKEKNEKQKKEEDYEDSLSSFYPGALSTGSQWSDIILFSTTIQTGIQDGRYTIHQLSLTVASYQNCSIFPLFNTSILYPPTTIKKNRKMNELHGIYRRKWDKKKTKQKNKKKPHGSFQSGLVWLRFFNPELSLKKYWRGPRSQGVGEEGE